MQTFQPTCLRTLRAGQLAVVEELCGCDDECQQLASMGFCAGALIRMITDGSPCAVQVGESRVMLRGSHTDAVRVCPLG